MLTKYQIKILDGILQDFYNSRDAIYELDYDFVFRSVTGSNDRKEWYLDKIVNDGFLEYKKEESYSNYVFPIGGPNTTNYGHITKAGVEFYEEGGYAAQSKAGELARQQDDLLREREVNAAEQSSVSSERSALSAEKAIKWGVVSMAVNIVGLIIGTSLAIWQNDRSNKQDSDLDSLIVKVNRLDSLLKRGAKQSHEPVKNYVNHIPSKHKQH